MRISVQIQGLEELLKALGARKITGVLDPGVAEWALAVSAALGTYPPRRRKRMQFRSKKQRRFFFAALAAGRITVPYRRTGTLGRSWTVRKKGALNRQVVNNTTYGPYVMGEKSQALYHQDTWPVFTKVAEQNSARGVAFLERRIQGYFNSL